MKYLPEGETAIATQSVCHLNPTSLFPPSQSKQDYLLDSGARPLTDILPSILCPQLPAAVWTGLHLAPFSRPVSV